MDNFEKACVVAIATIVLVAAFTGYVMGRDSIRKEAILLGHAHYSYNHEGSVKFKWSECIQF
jgi:hypothetical protein